MFGPEIQQRARKFAERVVRPLAALGLTPNMATFLGLVLNCLAAWVLATGNLRWGGALVGFAGVFDMFDGALARVRNQKTTFGAFFDSTLDRYSEGVVLLGLILFALTQPASAARTWTVALAYIAGLGSLLVSYARARAEGLGLQMKSGLMARPERVVVLSAGLILGGSAWLVWVLAILAVTSVGTSVQRIVLVYRALARGEGSSVPAAPGQTATQAHGADALATARETARDAMPASSGKNGKSASQHLSGSSGAQPRAARVSGESRQADASSSSTQSTQ